MIRPYHRVNSLFQCDESRDIFAKLVLKGDQILLFGFFRFLDILTLANGQ